MLPTIWRHNQMKFCSFSMLSDAEFSEYEYEYEHELNFNTFEWNIYRFPIGKFSSIFPWKYRSINSPCFYRVNRSNKIILKSFKNVKIIKSHFFSGFHCHQWTIPLGHSGSKDILNSVFFQGNFSFPWILLLIKIKVSQKIHLFIIKIE